MVSLGVWTGSTQSQGPWLRVRSWCSSSGPHRLRAHIPCTRPRGPMGPRGSPASPSHPPLSEEGAGPKEIFQASWKVLPMAGVRDGPLTQPSWARTPDTPQKGLEWPLVTQGPTHPAPQRAHEANPPVKIHLHTVPSHYLLAIRPH